MARSRNKISIVIIAFNEEANIEACILSCRSITDDIVIIDSNSTDRTIEIAEDLGASVFKSEWNGYGSGKNLGASKAKYDWVLSIDADERPNEEMVETLHETLLENGTLYSFRRKNFIGNVPILHGDWNPDIKERLYNIKDTQWNNEPVHENLMREKWQKSVTLPGELIHYTYKNLDEMKNRLDKYASLGAQQMIDNSLSPGLFSFAKPWFRFFKSYYLKSGFKDGNLGYEIARANAEAVSKKYKYYREKINK